MLADLGFGTLLIAFLASIYATIASVVGGVRNNTRLVESARNAVTTVLPLITAASVLLIIGLVTNDFSIRYVWSVTSIETPTYLKVTALWGGQEGSLLFWNLILAVFMAAAVRRKWREERELMTYATAFMAFTQVFFLAVTIFLENPFERLPVVPAEGNGLNPLLRHPGMIIHPPMLYLGYVGFIVPYSFAMGALISGKMDETWIRTTRRWSLIAWMFLGLGLILGGRWAYDVLGWGGYWGWDNVENVALLPWLSGTAFLHSVMIEEKRGMFRGWNLVWIVITYVLVISGILVVRGGLLSSVHTFAQSAVGPFFFVFLVVMIAVSIGLAYYRRHELHTDNRLESFLSREAAFLFNNFIMAAILIAVFIGTYFEMFSELFAGEKITVGAPYYETVVGPLFAVLLLLMGLAPLTMWYRTSAQRIGMRIIWPAVGATAFVVVLLAFRITHAWALLGFWIVFFSAELTLLEFYRGTRARMKRGENVFTAFSNLLARNRRRYGGYWIHMGVIIMGFGIIGVELFQQESQLRLNVGETAELGRYQVAFTGTSDYTGPDDLLIREATLQLYERGEYLRDLTPHVELYQRSGQPMTIPSMRSTIADDFYVIVVNWEAISESSAVFRLYLNPLINWVWAGGVIFVLGTAIAAWPDPVADKLVAARRAQRRMALSTD